MAAKIAAHSGDIAKGVKGAMERNIQMSKYRKQLDWDGMYNLALDPDLPKKRRSESENSEKSVCTMCGDLCAVKIHNEMCVKDRQDKQD